MRPTFLCVAGCLPVALPMYLGIFAFLHHHGVWGGFSVAPFHGPLKWDVWRLVSFSKPYMYHLPNIG
jgi:hypothetical protein